PDRSGSSAWLPATVNCLQCRSVPSVSATSQYLTSGDSLPTGPNSTWRISLTGVLTSLPSCRMTTSLSVMPARSPLIASPLRVRSSAPRPATATRNKTRNARQTGIPTSGVGGGERRTKASGGLTPPGGGAGPVWSRPVDFTNSPSLLRAGLGLEFLEVRLDGVAVFGGHAAGQLDHRLGPLLLGQLAPHLGDLPDPLHLGATRARR